MQTSISSAVNLGKQKGIFNSQTSKLKLNKMPEFNSNSNSN